MSLEFVARNGLIALDSSQITGSLTTTGNVGIGTSSPSTKLHLYESTLADVVLRLTPADGGYDPLIQLTGQGNNITQEGFEVWYDNDIGDVHLSTTYVDNAASIHFHTRTGASKSTSNERLTILGNGNVGIGSTAPSNLLDVTTNLDAAQRVAIFRNLFSTGYTSIAIDRPNTARYSFLEHTTAGTTDWYVGTGYNGGAGNSAYQIGTGINLSDAKLMITTGGNVGIGTTSPGGLLQVGVPATSTGALRAYGSFVSIDAGYQSAGVFGTAAAPSLIFGGDDNTGIWHPASDVLAVSTAGSERMRITSGGSVGIGTTAPARPLHVNAAGTDGTQIQINGTLDSAGIKFIPVSGDNWEVQANTSNQWFVYNRTDSAYRLLIDGSGNVGIGTTAPSQLLEVQGSAQIGNDSVVSAGLIFARKNTNQVRSHYFLSSQESPTYQWIEGGFFTSEMAGISVANNSGKPYYEQYSPATQFKSFGFINQTTSGSSFTNTAATASVILYQGGTIALAPTLGNVGIGTTSPGYKLHVSGNLYVNNGVANGSGVSLFVQGSGDVQLTDGGSIFWGDYSYANSTYIRGFDNSDVMSFYSNGTNIVTMKSSGVGISTTAPAQKLHIHSGSAFIVGGLAANATQAYTASGRLIFNDDFTDVARGPNKITLYGSGTTWVGGFGIHSGTVSYYTGQDHRFYRMTGTDVSTITHLMVISGSGNVGIGMTTPSSSRLTVNGNVWATSFTGSLLGTATTASYIQNAASSSYALSASIAFNAVTASHALNAVTASRALNANTASFATSAANATSASYATFAATASSADNFNVRGTLTATTIVVQTITSSQSLITGSTIFGQLGTNTHQFTGSLRVSGSGDHWIMGGNVGIGTVVPRNKLHVNDSTGIRVSSEVGGDFRGITFGATSGDTAEYSYIKWMPNSGEFKIYANTAGFGGFMSFYSNNSEAMRINSVGSVGIGTTGPASLLHVNGNATIGYSTATAAPSNGLLVNGNVGIGNTTAPHKLVINGDSTANDATSNNAAINIISSTVNRTAIRFHQYNQVEYTVGIDTHSTSGNFRIVNTNGPINLTGSVAGIIINPNGSVGIGTAAPSTKLHVEGTITVTNGGINIPADTPIRKAGDNAIITYSSTLPGISIGSGTVTDMVVINAGGSEKVRIDTNGNVGIGTTNPITQLHIQSSGNEPGLAMRSTAAGGRIYRIFTNPSWATGSLQIYDTTSDNSVIHINSSGNVGINVGATNPTLAKLQVNGNVWATSFTGSFSGSFNGTITSASYATFAATATSATTAGSVTGTSGQLLTKDDRIIEPNSISSGYMQFGFTSFTNDNNSPWADYIHLRSYTDASGGSDNLLMFNKSTGFGMRLWQQTFNSATAYASYRDIALISGSTAGYVPFWTQYNQLLNSNIVYNGANVGIGTTAPGATLQVGHFNGTTNEIIRISVNYSSANAQRGALTWHDTAGITGKIWTTYDGISQTKLHFGGLYNSGYDQGNYLTIQGNGNVGIGTTTPSASLHVFVSNGPELRLSTAVGTGGVQGFKILKGDSGTAYINNQDNFDIHFQIAGSTKMLLNTGGNLGIGTTAPIAKLVVTGNGTGQGLIGDLFGSGNYTGISLNGSNSAANYNFLSSPTDNALYINRPSGLAIKFREANGGDQLTIATGGNVGIGTTAPGRQLEIYNATDAYLKFNGQRANNRAYTIGNDASGFIIYDENSGAYRMVISGSNGNVGIGTTAPTARLHVSASTGVVFEVDGASAATILYVSASGNVGIGTTNPQDKFVVVGGNIFLSGSSPSIWIGANNADSGNRLRLHNNGTENYIDYATGALNFRYGTNLSTVFSSTGNVGIGTTNPIGKLQIGGTSGNLLTVGTLTNNWAGDVAIGVTNGNGVIISKINTANDTNRVLVFYRDDTNGATIWGYTPTGGSTDIGFQIRANAISYFNGGNVGIGSTLPAFKLDVYSTTSATARFYNNQATATFDFGSSTNTSYSDIILRASSGTGEIFKAGTGYTSYGGVNALNIYNSNAGIHFFPNGTGTSVMAITGSSVGIGTTTPAFPLTIYNSNAAATVYQTSGTGTGLSNGFYVGHTSNISYVWNYNNYPLVLATNNTERMRINADGNVGIGTTSPGYKLDVIGNSRIQASSGSSSGISVDLTAGNSSNDSIIDYGYWGAGFDASIWTAGMYGSDGLKWKIRATNTGVAFDRFVVETGGNVTMAVTGSVGIGTTSPVTRLNVKEDNTGTEGFIITNWNSVNTVKLGSDSATGGGKLSLITNGGATNVFVSSYASSYFNGGNVGIGTTSPQARLHIGPVNGDTAAHLYLASGNNSYGWRIDTQDSGAGVVPLRIWRRTAGSDTQIITANNADGNVGIGSTSPAYKLDVSGTIRATADIIAYSDARVKENVTTVENALEKVKALRGVTYTRKDTEDKSRKLGVIAQEVLEILPEVVQQDTSGNYSVAYGNMVGVLIEAIKEQQRQIDDLKYLLQTQNK